jgi:hypothetical protein
MFDPILIVPKRCINDTEIADAYFSSLSTHYLLTIINKTINEYFIAIHPSVALKLIIPQKKEFNAGEKTVKNTLLKAFPFLEKIQSHEQLIETLPFEVYINVYQTYQKLNQEFFLQYSNLQSSVKLQPGQIPSNQLYPLFLFTSDLNDDFIKFPNMDSISKKQDLLSLLYSSLKHLKQKYKKKSKGMEDVFPETCAMMFLIQKLNTLFKFSPFEEHYGLIPAAAEYAKTLEWLVANVLTDFNLAKLDAEEKNAVEKQRIVLTHSVNQLYLEMSEGLVYSEKATLEDLNYAEWCSDKFYAHSFLNKHLELTKILNRPSISDPETLRKNSISRYFLNRTLIEAKRQSFELSFEFLQDFIRTIKSDTIVSDSIGFDRIYLTVFKIQAGLTQSAQKIKFLDLIKETVDIVGKDPKFITYTELQEVIKKAKLNVFVDLLKIELESKNNLIFSYNANTHLISLVVPETHALKKPRNKPKLPSCVDSLQFLRQVNQINLALNLEKIDLNFVNLEQQAKKIAQVIHKTINLKPIVSEIVSPEIKELLKIVETQTITRVLPISQINTESELCEKLAGLLLKETLPEENIPPQRAQKPIEKSEKKLTIPTPVAALAPVPAPIIAARPILAGELGFRNYANHIAIPVYFGLNQKKKSTNTYLVWDKVDKLDEAGEQHFKSLLDERGVDVAKNVNQAGIKIKSPPSQKNNPNFAFIRLKSKSKQYGGMRVFAEFKEQAACLLPEHEGKPVYLYSFGKMKHK